MERQLKLPAPITRVLAWGFPLAVADSGEPPPLLPHQPETVGWFSLAIGVVIFTIVGLSRALQPPHGASLPIVWGVTLLYFGGLTIITLARWAPDVRLMTLGFVAVLLVSIVLRFSLDGLLGLTLMEYLLAVVAYRLPVRRSLPLVCTIAATYLLTGLLRNLVLGSRYDSVGALMSNLLVITLITIGTLTLRSRMVLIVRLKHSQAQLRAEMARTGELAAARERARIARDMHDVLAHSLTVLSIQTQAARRLVTQQPERAAATLDEMAGVLHESIAESRRVVGLLRETSHVPADDSPLGTRLLTLVDRFAARTGVCCSLQERGTPRAIGAEHESTLQFALQEALTNAYRHGAAQHVWVELIWRPDTIILTARDDGAKQSGGTTESGGGNGLRGMRERVAALGGTVSTGWQADGGFAVTLTLPTAVSNH